MNTATFVKMQLAIFMIIVSIFNVNGRFKVHHTEGTTLCPPYSITLEATFTTPDTFEGTIKMSKTKVLVRFSAYTVKTLYTGINGNEMDVEKMFIFDQERGLKLLSEIMNGAIVSLRVVCYFDRFSCSFAYIVNGSVILYVVGDSKMYNVNRISPQNVSAIYDETSAQTLIVNQNTLIQRWKEICNTIIDIDNGPIFVTFIYNVSAEVVTCEFSAGIPLEYTITLSGGTLRSISSNMEFIDNYVVITASNHTPLAHITGITCMIISPSGWISLLQNPTMLYDNMLSSTLSSYTNDNQESDNLIQNNTHSVTASVSVVLIIVSIITICVFIFRERVRTQCISFYSSVVHRRLYRSGRVNAGL